MPCPRHKVLVLGAGVNGLSSALRIQESCDNNVEVTIMAETFSPNTTSDGSGGFWEVFFSGDTDAKLLQDLSHETYTHLLDLAFSASAATVRVQQLSGYDLSDTTLETDHDFKDIVDGYRKMSKEELSRWPMAKDGRFFTTLVVTVTAYLKWLTDRILSNGGHFVKRKVHSLQELSSEWDVIVNCLGLGSYKVLGDDMVYPVRGQVFRVHAPWITHFCILDSPQTTTYILPNVDYVTVGGTLQPNDWREEVDEQDAKAIWTRAVQLLPSLKGAKILKKWAGLRPARKSLRLESEVIGTNKTQRLLHVVHNYGHGGSGITLHWGCARKTAEMVSQILKNMNAGDVGNGDKKMLHSKL